MTQGDLEKIPKGMERLLRGLEVRIMDDMVRRIRLNAFSTASADWQFTRLQQLGQSEEDIKAWVKELLRASNEEIDRIYSEEAYEEYMGHGRGYQVYGRQQIPFEENVELQQLIEGVKQQTAEQMQQITGSMGFVTKGYSGNLNAIQLSQYYQDTLDRAVMDLHSGAFDYSTVLNRTINEMTRSGLRWIDYESGWHNRVPVAARRAVMTGFRQVQGKINEQTARDLGTDSYEVTVHIGARPSHQVWEGKVYTMEQLRSVCGLGTGAGLHGWNCYHDYNAFIPGVSVRTYTDEQLDQIHEDENTPRTYQGKEYTTYEALQQQRKLETRVRKYREDVHLLEEGSKDLPEADQQAVDSEIILKQCRLRKTMQEYKAFSRKMDLPMQKERIYQDGLKVDMRAPNGAGTETRGRRIRYGSMETFERDDGEITARKINTKSYNNLFVEQNVKISSRELRRINNQITEAKRLMGVSDECRSQFVVVDTDRTLAAYNPRTDTFYISRMMADEKNIIKHQADFVCPDNPNSTMVHEMFHWKDAENYRTNKGPILEAGPDSPYSRWERTRSFYELKKEGLTDPKKARKVSKYAFDKLLDNKYEEVYTEVRTRRCLTGVI